MGMFLALQFLNTDCFLLSKQHYHIVDFPHRIFIRKKPTEEPFLNSKKSKKYMYYSHNLHSYSSPSSNKMEEEHEDGHLPHYSKMTVEKIVKLLALAEDPVWELLRFEAHTSANIDSTVAPSMTSQILNYNNIGDASRALMSYKLKSTFLGIEEINTFTKDLCANYPSLRMHFRQDVLAPVLHDSSIPNLISSFLYDKGFHAVATYRLSHYLQISGRQTLARYLQSLNSEYFAADIHPSCKIGNSLFLSSGTCVVIGETATIGDDVILMQGVTLGGTGKEKGDRHPKIGNGVILSAASVVLGNIQIGDGCIIGSRSVVLRPLPSFTRGSGVPAKIISTLWPQLKSVIDNEKLWIKEGEKNPVSRDLNFDDQSIHVNEDNLPKKTRDTKKYLLSHFSDGIRSDLTISSIEADLVEDDNLFDI